jgi:hypothetical protein
VNQRAPMSRTPAPDKLPRQQEAELIAAAAGVFRTGFPNPERIGCPPQGTLHAVARKAGGTAETESILEHLTCCSQCFTEYERLVHKERVSRNLKVLALCASLLITTALAIWFYVLRTDQEIRQPEPTIIQQPPPVTEQPTPTPVPPIQYEVAVVDLRNRGPIRGEQQPAAGEDVVASLPARPLELSVYLPIGSEEGQYELQILREADRPLVTASGLAKFEDRNVILRLKADLTGLTPGRYLLGLRKGRFRWAYYPISAQ